MLDSRCKTGRVHYGCECDGDPNLHALAPELVEALEDIFAHRGNKLLPITLARVNAILGKVRREGKA